MMNSPKKAIFVVILSGLLAGFAPQQVVASGGLRTVALTGQAAPGAGEGVVLKDPSTYYPSPSMNTQGHVAYWSTVAGVGVETSNDSGFWVNMGSNSLLVAREGEIAPGTSGALFGSMSAININNAEGEAAFSAELSGAGVDESSDRGIWRVAADGAKSLVVREGDPASETGSGVIFKAVRLEGLSDAGELVFTGWLDGAGVDHTNDYGIWRQQTGQAPVMVLRAGNSAPGVIDGQFDRGLYMSTRFNDLGQLVLSSALVGTNINTENNTGIWSEVAGNGLELIARQGDTVPGVVESVTFSRFSPTFRSNNVGQTGFNAYYRDESNSFAGRGAFLSNTDGDVVPIAVTGDPAPGLGAGAHMSAIFLDDMNDAGYSAISGFATDSEGNYIHGNAVWSDAGGGGFELIAHEGDSAPGLESGAVFRYILQAGLPKLNNHGDLAFAAYAGTLPGGLGLWAKPLAGDLHLILKQWDLLDVSDDPANPDLRVISGLSLLDNQVVSDTSGVDGVEQLLLSIRFTDGSSGIFTSDLSPIPIPGDFDLDRDTDGADFLAWQRGDSPTPLDAAELALWQQAFGGGQNLPAGASAAVPEPSGLLLLGLGGLLWGCQRGRKQLYYPVAVSSLPIHAKIML